MGVERVGPKPQEFYVKKSEAFPPPVQFLRKHLLPDSGYAVQIHNLGLPHTQVLHYMPNSPNRDVPPVVFVHGMGHSMVHFDRLASELSGKKGIECISIGIFGHLGDSYGYTRNEFAFLALEEYGADVRRKLVKASGYFNRPFTVIGHSMGGLPILLALSGKDEQLSSVTQVVLLNSAGTSDFRLRRSKAMLGQVALHLPDLLFERPIALSPKAARRIFFNDKISDADFKWFWETYQEESMEAVWQMIKASFGPHVPLLRYRPAIDIGQRRVLTVASREDRLVYPETSRDIAIYLRRRGASVEEFVLPKAPHDSIITHPRELAHVIERFLNTKHEHRIPFEVDEDSIRDLLEHCGDSGGENVRGYVLNQEGGRLALASADFDGHFNLARAVWPEMFPSSFTTDMPSEYPFLSGGVISIEKTDLGFEIRVGGFSGYFDKPAKKPPRSDAEMMAIKKRVADYLLVLLLRRGVHIVNLPEQYLDRVKFTVRL